MLTITDPLVLTLVRARLSQLSSGELFCGHSPKGSRSLLYDILNFLEIADNGFKWYSLRRGGATYFFSMHGSMDMCLYRGRWDHSRTAKIYITNGILALSEIEFSDRQRSLMNQGCAYLQTFIARH